MGVRPHRGAAGAPGCQARADLLAHSAEACASSLQSRLCLPAQASRAPRSALCRCAEVLGGSHGCRGKHLRCLVKQGQWCAGERKEKWVLEVFSKHPDRKVEAR